jgi:hypothetical protein
MNIERPNPAPTPDQLAGWNPPQVDEMVAAIWSDLYAAMDHQDRAHSTIKHYRKRRDERGELPAWDARALADAETAAAECRERIEVLHAERGVYDGEFRRRPWPRYYHVDNNNGHVHTSMNCQTCYASTRYRWLTEISGQDEDACVALVGETACTVCMPSAPVKPGYGDGTSGWARRTAEQQAARDAEKAAKAAAREAKAIYDVDGSPLRVDGWVIKTLVAAKQSLTDAVERSTWEASNPTYRQEKLADRDQLAAAIAHKTGEPTEKVIADAVTRAEKRAKRNR